MKKLIFISVLATFLGGSPIILAQGPKDFPDLINADIPGAPKLGKPMLITGTTGPVKSEGLGWAAPAVWDWDGDGKKDLLIGEFGSGIENGQPFGHFIRVYKNVGTDIAPEFTDKFHYANYARGQSPNGTPISVHQFCCIGFTPQFVDLDDDGLKDMITGQYQPGEVTWFRNTEAGFQAGIKLQQAGDPSGPKTALMPVPGKKDMWIHTPDTDPKSSHYWQYSSASFGDFDGDGDYDLITGGKRLRISENIGSKTQPKFDFRQQLLDINGEPLKVYQYPEERLKKRPDLRGTAGDLTVPLVVDWDQDGVLDLLVTGSYGAKGSNVVTFFRGVKTRKGPRFEPGKALFTRKRGGKAFPGSWIRVYVTDWNNDGVNDLLIGASVATVKGGKFDHNLSWSWEADTGISKQNPGLPSHSLTLAKVKSNMKAAKRTSEDAEKRLRKQYAYYLNGGDLSLIHQGYVYVMLGEPR